MEAVRLETFRIFKINEPANRFIAGFFIPCVAELQIPGKELL